MAPSPTDDSGSPIARRATAAWAAMIIFASLTPWSGWQDRGIDPWAYLTAPWPSHLPHFDVAINILGYLPLGGGLVLSVYPRLRGVAAVVFATLAGSLLSALIEGLQTYLPVRVPSNVDLLTNGFGALAGAILAVGFAPGLIERGRMAQWRRDVFVPGESIGLLLAATWPLAQSHPMPMLYGLGRLPGLYDLVEAQLQEWNRTLAPAPVFGQGLQGFVLAEAISVTAAVLSLALGFGLLVRAEAPRTRLVLALLAAGVLAKTAAYGVDFGPDHALMWWTAGAAAGLILGALVLPLTAALRPAAPALAIFVTVFLLVIVNAVPDNPYFSDWLANWRPGALRPLHDSAAWLATAWPYAWLAWLLRRGLRGAARAKPPRSA